MADTNPPAPAHQSGEYPAAHDVRDHNLKLTVVISILAAICGSVLTAGVVWGQSTAKLDNATEDASKANKKNEEQDKQLVELKLIAERLASAQAVAAAEAKAAKEATEKAEKANADAHAELKKQLDRMESKIDKK